MSGSNGKAPRDAAARAVVSARERLAVAEHERRHAIYEAREEHGERPSAVPAMPPRDKLPTFDDLTAPGPAGWRARWRLVLAVSGALVALAGAVQQLISLLHH